jgi:hypothetical protein
MPSETLRKTTEGGLGTGFSAKNPLKNLDKPCFSADSAFPGLDFEDSSGDTSEPRLRSLSQLNTQTLQHKPLTKHEETNMNKTYKPDAKTADTQQPQTPSP